MFPSFPLPHVIVNSDDYNRVMLLAERVADVMPYVSAYLDRELRRAEVRDPWDPAGVSMGQRVSFWFQDEAQVRLGRLSYPNRPIGETGNIPILSPIGAALIGMQRNASIEFLLDGRIRTLEVLDYGW